MQLSDSQQYLGQIFEIGKEIVAYRGENELIEKLNYYLEHDDERKKIALNGYRRVLRDYRFSDILRKSADYIVEGMAQN
jgi:spore maturation protein CgeB